jgi:hypothetical protein
MTPARRIPQQHVAVFRPCLVEPLDLEVRHALHDDGMRGGVVHGGLATGESGRRPEPAVGVAEVRDGGGARVLGGRVGDGHVGFGDEYVRLGWGVSVLVYASQFLLHCS